jgi:class 3 adenylate cyclase
MDPMRRKADDRPVSAERDIADIRAVLYRMTGSYGAKDVDGVMDTFVADVPMLVGTGIDELRFNANEVRFQIERDSSEPDAVSIGMDNLRATVFGDAAFAYTDVMINATFGERHQTFPVRMTFGLVRTEEGWRVAQSHTSVPEKGLPEGRSFPVQLTKTLSELLTSIDSDTGSAALEAMGLGTTTIVFTDIVDSTSLSQSMGDREWSSLIKRHFDTVEGIVESMGGSVVKTLGDGGMFAFGSGTSALITSMKTQQAMASLEERPLMVRIGVHTGDVVRDRDDYIGLTVSKAARVAAAAQGGQVLVSSTTADIVNSSEIEFGEPLAVELKGIEGVHTLLPLNWATKREVETDHVSTAD